MADLKSWRLADALREGRLELDYFFGAEPRRLSWRGAELQDLSHASPIRLQSNYEKLADGSEVLRLSASGAEGAVIERCCLTLPIPLAAASGLMAQGFQSWTETFERSPQDRIPRPRWLVRSFMRYYGSDAVHPSPARDGQYCGFGSLAIKSGDSLWQVLASLSEDQAHTIFETDTKAGQLRVQRDLAGQRMGPKLELFSLYFSSSSSEAALTRSWLQAAGIQARLDPSTTPHLRGWTSWYKHYTRISEDLIHDQLQAWSSEDLDIFQIDDGYQAAVGDWLHCNSKFPQGLAPIAQAIKARNWRPGLWLAPFACESRIARQHPDWLLRDKAGKPIPMGYNPFWSGWYYGFDPTHPEVQSYLREVFRELREDAGFELFKLDFLFIAGVQARHGNCRGRVLAEALSFLREIAGDAWLLGCGVPLAQAMGRFELCRVGADVAESWETRTLAFLRVPERLSTLGALRSVLARWALGGPAFLNDPDVVLIRAEDNKLSAREKHSLALAALIAGQLLFCSDDPRLFGEAERWLWDALHPRPSLQIDAAHHRIDGHSDFSLIELSAEGRHYLLLFNLSNKSRTWPARERLFDARARRLIEAGERITLAPRESCALPLSPSSAQVFVAGCDGHILPGAALSLECLEARKFKLELAARARGSRRVFLCLPEGMDELEVNGLSLVKESGQSLVEIFVEARRTER